MLVRSPFPSVGPTRTSPAEALRASPMGTGQTRGEADGPCAAVGRARGQPRHDSTVARTTRVAITLETSLEIPLRARLANDRLDLGLLGPVSYHGCRRRRLPFSDQSAHTINPVDEHRIQTQRGLQAIERVDDG